MLVQIFRISFLVAVLASCTTYKYQRLSPKVKGPIGVVLNPLNPNSSNIDAPVGAYRVPNSEVIISGHQRVDTMQASILVGVFGGYGADGINKHVAEKNAQNFGDRTLADIRFRDIIDRHLSEKIKNSGKTSFILNDKTQAYTLLIEPALVLTFVEGNRVIPHVVVRARLVHKRSEIWENRFFASSNGARLIEGEDGWLKNDAQLLKQSISTSSKKIVDFILGDVISPEKNHKSREVTLTGNFPFVHNRFQLRGKIIGEDKSHLFFAPQITDVNVFAGLNIIDKNLASYRAPKKTDPELVEIQ